jgi:hypothetical protein
MLRSETVFVIGAGASKEVGLPIGNELASTIRARMDIEGTGDRDIFNEINLLADIGDKYRRAASRIRDGIILTNSIDYFLDQNNDDPYIKLYGKAAIVKSIIEAERNSSMFIARGQRLNYDNLASSWYVSFFKMRTRGINKSNLDSIFNGLSFVSFNYGRCLEFFLLNALQQSYGIDASKAADICNTAIIFHPYGVVGALPHQNKNIFVPFGGDEMVNNCVDLAKQIRKYTEDVSVDSRINSIKDAICKARVVVFLGFGFCPQNIDILAKSVKAGSMPKDIFATGYGISIKNTKQYSENLAKRFHCRRVGIEYQQTCFSFLNSVSASIFG